MSTQPQNKLVPALRFPQFANADAWQSVRLGEVCERITRKNSENNQNVLTISAQEGLISQSDYFNKIVASNNITNYYLLYNGEFAYNKSRSQGYEYGAIKPLKKYDKGVVSTLYICFNVKDGNDKSYFEYFFETGLLNKQIGKIAQEGARNHGLLNIAPGDFFERTNCVLPTLPEQQKIASCLSSLDEYISLTKKKLDLLKLHKKGLLENLFPRNGQSLPKLRFPGFVDDWKVVKLGEVGDTFTGLSGKNKDDFGHGDAEYITYLNVFQNPIAKQEPNQPIEIDGKQNSVIYGDVFFTTSSETPNEVGMSSVWLYNKANVYLNSFCFGYRINIDIDYIYLSYYLRSDYFRKLIVVLAQGISRYNISKIKVMDLPLLLPPLAEQERIASCLSSIDYEIASYDEKIKAMEVHKKGLMQKLFPKIS